MQRQVQTARDQLRDLHTSNESTQAKLLSASERQGLSATFSGDTATAYKAEQDVAARLAELDIVAADLTRANERVATVERRNVKLHQTLRVAKAHVRNCSEQRSSLSEVDLLKLKGVSQPLYPDTDIQGENARIANHRARS